MGSATDSLPTSSTLDISKDAVPLPRGRSLTGTVSAFGLTGTLAVAIVESDSERQLPDCHAGWHREIPVILSAHDELGLQTTRQKWLDIAVSSVNPPCDFFTAASISCFRRVHHERRIVLWARTWKDFFARLRGVRWSTAIASSRPTVLFSAHGAASLGDAVETVRVWMRLLCNQVELVGIGNGLLAYLVALNRLPRNFAEELWTISSRSEVNSETWKGVIKTVATTSQPGSAISPSILIRIQKEGEALVAMLPFATSQGWRTRCSGPQQKALEMCEKRFLSNGNELPTCGEQVYSLWSARHFPPSTKIGAAFWIRHLEAPVSVATLNDFLIDADHNQIISRDEHGLRLMLDSYTTQCREANPMDIFCAQLSGLGVMIDWRSLPPSPSFEMPSPLYPLPPSQLRRTPVGL